MGISDLKREDTGAIIYDDIWDRLSVTISEQYRCRFQSWLIVDGHKTAQLYTHKYTKYIKWW